jgi:glycolate oxidase
MESYNAKGFVTLAFNLFSGDLKPGPDLVDKFYHCLTCMNCRFKCPPGINIPEIVLGARERLVEAGLMPAVFKAMTDSMGLNGNPFDQPQGKRTEFYPEALAARIGKEHIAKAEVVIFAGCIASYQDISLLQHLVKVLDAAGVNYAAMGNEERCCGFPAFLIGGDALVKEHVKKNEEAFKRLGVTRLVTQCSGCYRFFKEVFPRHSKYGLEVLHSVEYLYKLLKEGRLKFKKPFGKKVLYHDPCDLGRHMQVFEQPREILKAVLGLTLLEFPENRNLSRCCGGGGGFKAFDPGMSTDIALKKVRQALDLGAEVITSACPTCKDNLALAAARLKQEGDAAAKRLKVMDLTELLAKVV